MKGLLYRGDISSLSASFLSTGATAEREPSGIFENRRRFGAVVAAIVVVAAIAAGVIALMSDGSGSLQAPTEAERPIKAAAPVAANDTPSSPRATVTTARGPRVGLDRTVVKTPLQADTASAAAKLEAPRPASISTTGPRGSNATAAQAPVAASAHAAASARSPVADADPPTGAHRAGTTSGGIQISEPARTTGASASAMPEDAAPPPATKAPQPASGLVAATTTTPVHLRAGPDNNAKIIATVPENAAIMAPPSCKFWCTVEYRGQRGYIYKDFVKRPGSGTGHG